MKRARLRKRQPEPTTKKDKKRLRLGGLSLLGIGSIAAITTTLSAAGAVSGPPTVGPKANGTAILPNGWKATPAGRQVQLGEMPFGSAMSPDGKTLLVSNDGQNVESLQAIDVASGNVVQTINYNPPQQLFIGVGWSPDGTHVYASAGANNVIRVYDVAGQHLTETTPIALPGNPQPAGLTVSADGKQLYVANELSDTVSVVDVASGAVTASIPVGPAPYSVLLANGGRTAFASNWGGNTMSVIDTATNTVRRTVTVGEHPTAMALDPVTGQVFVVNGDSDSVSVLNGSTGSMVRQIDVSPYPNAPTGSQPSALSMSPDGRTLYVTNAGDNDVVAIKLAQGRHGYDTVAGLIPTGWYPTGVQVANHGTKLWVTSAKGLGTGPNPNGPDPLTGSEGPTTGDPSTDQYILSLMRGDLQVIGVPSKSQLAGYTNQVRDNDGFNNLGPVTGTSPVTSSVIPRRVGQTSPIKHVIYVVKENRTYDQMLGDLGRGNGDRKLELFPASVSPNQHQLAKQFVTLDNFYADGEVTNEGWEWTSAGATNLYNEAVTPGTYTFDGRAIGTSSAAAHAYDPGPNPQSAYIWDQLITGSRSFRDYGFEPTGNDPALAAFMDPNFAPFNTAITDRSRIAEWKTEFANYENTNTLPALEMMELGDDHTSGTGAGTPTPSAQVADNDYALGQLVDTVSHSKDWADTAIFVVEDDAQDGADHVDAHRTIAQVISPYTEYGTVDSNLYSQVSILHTIELILGLKSMSQFDAAAMPMASSFRNQPNLTPYNVITPKQDMDQQNTSASPMAAQSATWNFKKADDAPDALLNRAIWESVKGENIPMPSSVSSGVPDTNYYGGPTGSSPVDS